MEPTDLHRCPVCGRRTYITSRGTVAAHKTMLDGRHDCGLSGQPAECITDELANAMRRHPAYSPRDNA